jgi:hypothetical protein
MSGSVSDVPLTPVCVRREYLRNLRDGHGLYERAYLYGVVFVPARPPRFMVHLESGAIYSRLPVDALVYSPGGSPPALPPYSHDYYSCMSGDGMAYRWEYLKDAYMSTRFGAGRYLFTLEFFEGGFAEVPEQEKQAHCVALDEGPLVLVPNNRMVYRPEWLTDTPTEPDYLRCEQYWQARE